MGDEVKVQIRRVVEVPSRDGVKMDAVRAFYKEVDTNGDGVISNDELRTFNFVKGLSLLGALNSKDVPKALKAHEAKYDQFIAPQNLLGAFGDKLFDKKQGGYPLKVLEDIAKRDGNAKDISVADIGQKTFDYDTQKHLPDHDVAPAPVKAAEKK